jgi:hypothetical protein
MDEPTSAGERQTFPPRAPAGTTAPVRSRLRASLRHRRVRVAAAALTAACAAGLVLVPTGHGAADPGTGSSRAAASPSVATTRVATEEDVVPPVVSSTEASAPPAAAPASTPGRAPAAESTAPGAPGTEPLPDGQPAAGALDAGSGTADPPAGAAAAAASPSVPAQAPPNGEAGALARVPYVAVVGDSYTLAANAYYAPAPAPTWPVYVAQRLGWRIVQTNANPGAGFLAPGASGTFLDMLRAQPLPHDADIVLVQGGLNDAAYDPARVPAAVDAVLDLVHLQAPRATVIVIGAFQPFVDRLVAPTQLAVARAMGSPAAIGSDRYLAGYLLGYEVLPDAVHPTARGHEQIGAWVGERLIHGLDSGSPLRLAPSGDYYIP